MKFLFDIKTLKIFFIFLIIFVLVQIVLSFQAKRVILDQTTENFYGEINNYEGFICCLDTKKLYGDNQLLNFVNSFLEWVCSEQIVTTLNTFTINPEEFLYLDFPGECKPIENFCSFQPNKGDLGAPGDVGREAMLQVLKQQCSKLTKPLCAKEGEKGKHFTNLWRGLRCCPNLKQNFFTGICESK